MGPRHVSDTSFPEDHFSDPEGGSALLGAHEASVAVRKRHDEEMGPMPHASDDRIRLAKVRLSMAWRMRQRHERLPVATADNGLARVY